VRPAPVSEKQLKELHLQLSLTAREKLKGEAAPKAAESLVDSGFVHDHS
jgi:hypothetical protein